MNSFLRFQGALHFCESVSEATWRGKSLHFEFSTLKKKKESLNTTALSNLEGSLQL